MKTLLFSSGEQWVTIDGEAHRLPVSHAGAPLRVSAPGVASLVLNGRELSTTELTRNASGRVVFSVVETR